MREQPVSFWLVPAGDASRQNASEPGNLNGQPAAEKSNIPLQGQTQK